MEFTTKNNKNYIRRRKQLVGMIKMGGPDFLIYQFAVNMLVSMFGFSILRLIGYIAFRELKLRWLCFKARFERDELDRDFDEIK